MVSSRHRSSLAAAAASQESPSSVPSKVPKPKLEEWTTKEKLFLASLAIKHGNAWNSVARNMQSVFENDRPEGWSNTKTCAAQFDKLMNELGVDKRPKRNEPSDGNSSCVIYKKMAQKRIKELEDNITELRKLFINSKSDEDSQEETSQASDMSDRMRGDTSQSSTSGPNQSNKLSEDAASTGSKTTTRTSSISVKNESEKPPTRALTRRESSRKNLEMTLSNLCKEASEIKSINLFCKPADSDERELYDKIVKKHMDLTEIKKRLGSEVEDAFAVINDLMLMFQNAIYFYPPENNIHKTAIELKERLVPIWEKSLLDAKPRTRH